MFQDLQTVCPLKRSELSQESGTNACVAKMAARLRTYYAKGGWSFQIYVCQPHATWPIYQSGLKLGHYSSKLKFCIFLTSVFIHLRKIFYSGKKYFWDKTMLSFKIVTFAKSPHD